MELTSDILDLLHDGRLLGVQIDFGGEARSIAFTATYHYDCGLDSLACKTVVLTAEDVTLLVSCVHGAVTGLETIDTCDLNVSEQTAAQLTEWLRIGGSNPKARLSLKTHTGSVWEVMCESLSFKIL